MITINELRKALNRIAPEESAESWDNCGFQINTGRENYSRILVCLEITKAVIEEAKEKKAELIITHHPLYFGSFKEVDNNKIIGNYTIELISGYFRIFFTYMF